MLCMLSCEREANTKYNEPSMSGTTKSTHIKITNDLLLVRTTLNHPYISSVTKDVTIKLTIDPQI